MTRATDLLSKIYEDFFGLGVNNPVGRTTGMDNAADIGDNNGSDLNIDVVTAIGDVIQGIVDDLDDDDLDDISPLIEGYLDEVDPEGNLDVADAVCLLPAADAQDLYSMVTAWCNSRGIDYDDSALDNPGGDDNGDGGENDDGAGGLSSTVGPQGFGSIG